MTTDSKPTQTAMEGSGFYNKHSSAQASGIARTLGLLERAANAVIVGDESLVVADYGASQGRNSMVPMRLAIETLRTKHGVERPVLVYHTDLPSNDFNSLFKTLKEDPNSYLKGASAIYPAAVGGSFFDTILPPSHVHLGWNSWAVHWLSQKSVDAEDHVSPTLSTVPAVRAAASQQSALDWESFLSARASELRNGGRLLCLVIVDTGGRVNSDSLWQHLWDAIVDAGHDGLLTSQQQLQITLPIWYRSMADLKAPFGTGNQYAGLQLEHSEATTAPDPFWASFEKTGDAAQFGLSWANTMRAISAPTILAALGEERGDLLDDICARYAVRVATKPVRYDWNLATVIFAKTA
jgi:SAM dependent carboxyl methyltransferase